MMAAVSTKQGTRAFIRPGGTAGGCEFCAWVGPWYDQDHEGVNQSAADAREHLGDEHPEKVTYWEDLL